MKHFVPLIVITSLLGLLGYQLFHAKTAELPSTLIGEKVPHFSLSELNDSQTAFTPKTFKGKVVLLNFWATWCSACVSEHAMLNKIANEYHVPIYSILYKDDAGVAKSFLANNGNPFQLTGLDKSGDAGIDFGIYGTPETFVVDQNGTILYRQVGAIDQTVWDTILAPILAQTEKKSWVEKIRHEI